MDISKGPQITELRFSFLSILVEFKKNKTVKQRPGQNKQQFHPARQILITLDEPANIRARLPSLKLRHANPLHLPKIQATNPHLHFDLKLQLSPHLTTNLRVRPSPSHLDKKLPQHQVSLHELYH